MLIIFANIEKKEFSLYNKNGLSTISFLETHLLYDALSNSSEEYFLYVTSAKEVDAKDLVALASQYVDCDLTTFEEEETALSLLHMTTKGIMPISEKLIFRGLTDFKTLKDIGIEDLDEMPILKKLINSHKLEFVSKKEARKIKATNLQEAQIKKDKQTKEEQRRSTVNGSNDSTSVRSEDGSVVLDDVISIDLNKPGMMSSGGRQNNESALLPGGF